MKTFINEIVELYHSKYSHDPLSTGIITPNRRAHRFIKQAIIDSSPTGGFMPNISSIDDFIFQHIPLVRIDEVDLTYLLFETFLDQKEEKNLDFDDFLSYASILLHDFNEIDLQLANGKAIFSYLNDAKAIQQWNPDGSPLSPSQKEYLRFYNQLAYVYTEFKDRLLSKQLCYQGMGYRYFVEHLDEILTEIPWKKMIFAGFNALTKSEEFILKSLYRKGITAIIWDADSYYLNDEMMEAGMYLRKYQSWHTNIKEQAKSHFLNQKKKIQITGTPGVLGQAKIAGQIITNNSELDDPKLAKQDQFINNTVIVPADENLLLPILNSLPKNILESTNITMGFPIQHSHAYRLAESLIKLHLHSSRMNQLNDQTARYHKDDLMEVWNN
ncbi:MAG: hypothetical protein GQ527_12340, partial [Bacteroidales bacterium]|nr:hypothetical protein [Bacteroidales bacterium]